MVSILESDELIERLIREAEGEESPQLVDSRLATPLNTAYRYVASSIAIISTLSPEQRKNAAIKLIDIAEACFRAIEKTLKRSGTDDNSLLQQTRLLLKRLDVFDQEFGKLQISEDTENIVGSDPESQWGHDDNGMPGDFGSDNIEEFIEPLAVRILKNNEDVPEEAAEGDPAEEEDPPVNSEATDQTVDDTGENEIISTLAAETDKEEEKEDMPPQFKTLENKVTDESRIHEETSHNLEMLDLLLKNNI